MTGGFYAIYYTGLAGSGFGVIGLMSGTIFGADSAGGIYDGKYQVNGKTSEVEGNLQLQVPPGTPLVTGIAAQNEPTTLLIPLQLPSDFEAGKPIKIETATGPVNVIFKKLRDLPIGEKEK